MNPGRHGGLVFAAVLLATAPALADGDAGHGRELAEKHCARCHVVGTFNPHGGIGSTPSLQWIKKLPDWRERFQSFYARRPHLAFVHVKGIEPLTGLPPYATPVELVPRDADDIFAFIETLLVPKGNSTVTPLDDEERPAARRKKP